MRRNSCRLWLAIIFLLTNFFVRSLHAQDLLQKKISVTIRHQPLEEALSEISHAGGYYFSYNSDLLPEDSIVSLTARGKTVKDILYSLLGNTYEFQENGHYIIIRKLSGIGRMVEVSGYVMDQSTGMKIPNASVSVQRQYLTTLTDQDGYFHLRFKNRFPEIQMAVNKIYFKDTLFQLYRVSNQNLIIALSPIHNVMLPEVKITGSSRMRSMWLSKWLISSRQNIRDINFSKFFVKQPFQYSVWPGLGTHGRMSAQVVNKFSLNILGGYAAGVNGFELGSLFNIDKNDVRYVQVAGLFNIVGGAMEGLQLAGLYNNVADTVKGMQVAGLANRSQNVKGVQFSGIGNADKGGVNGIQLAGILNLTRNLRGLQIGLVNISDTATGYSIGLVNMVKKNGYYKLTLSWQENQLVNAAFKSGNEKLYNIVLIGMQLARGSKLFSVGYGLGREFSIYRRLVLTTEITEQSFIAGYKKDNPVLVCLQPAFHFSLNEKLSLFVGPALSLYFPGASSPKNAVADPLLPANYFTVSSKIKGWLGFQAGLTIF
ncbi:MAG TPA: hypothetical protein VFL76_01575 [Edaphocola sp.]|nr:hypothetical protein [Edaphocola sp.]